VEATTTGQEVNEVNFSILHPITHGRGYKNSFCVPAAMSAALGITVQEAAARLREVRGKRSVAGAAPRDAEAAIREMPGLWASTEGEFVLSEIDMRFCVWLERRDEAAYNSTFLVSIGWPGQRFGHMVAVRGNQRADNLWGGPKPVWSYSMRWARLRSLTIILPDGWSGRYPYALPEVAEVLG
jgi:hypothetical protein